MTPVRAAAAVSSSIATAVNGNALHDFIKALSTIFFLVGLAACAGGTAANHTDAVTPVATPEPSPAAPTNRWELWLDGPHLRGAHIHQRRVYPELDGPHLFTLARWGRPNRRRWPRRDQFNRAWLEALLATVDRFTASWPRPGSSC